MSIWTLTPKRTGRRWLKAASLGPWIIGLPFALVLLLPLLAFLRRLL
jgi:hypothetical protein